MAKPAVQEETTQDDAVAVAEAKAAAAAEAKAKKEAEAKAAAEAKAKAAAEAAEAAAKRAATPLEPPTHAGSMEVAPYNPNAVAEFGNKFLWSLIAQAGAEEEAQKLAAAAGEAKQFLSFEMTRAIMDLSVKTEGSKDEVDVYSVFGTAKDVGKLNTRVLLQMGVLKREVTEDDTVQYVWTDSSIETMYSYTEELKKAQPDEYTRRFNNRKRLNMRLNEAYRAVAILRDQGLSTDDLYYSEAEDGSMVPTIRNAPKAIGGDTQIVQLNARKPVKGATLSPTMSSLVKLANDKHKSSAREDDRNDKGEQRKGEAQLGMSDEAFGRIVNTLRNAITAQEGTFTDEMKKQIKALSEFLSPLVKK